MLALGVLALVVVFLLFQVYRADQQGREVEAERRRAEAGKMEAEAKRVNDRTRRRSCA